MTFVITYNGELTCLTSHRMQHWQSPGAPQTVAQTARPAWLERAGTKLMPDADMREFGPTFKSVANFLRSKSVLLKLNST